MESLSLVPSEEVLKENKLRLARFEIEFHKSCSAVRSYGVELRDAKAYLLKELVNVAGIIGQDMRDYASEVEDAHNQLNTKLQAIKLEKAVLENAYQQLHEDFNKVIVERDTLKGNYHSSQTASETLQSVNKELMKTLQGVTDSHKESHHLLAQQMDSLRRENSQLLLINAKLKADTGRFAENLATDRQNSPRATMETEHYSNVPISHRLKADISQSRNKSHSELNVRREKRESRNVSRPNQRYRGASKNQRQKSSISDLDALVNGQKTATKRKVCTTDSDHSGSEAKPAPPKKRVKTKPSALDVLHTDQTSTVRADKGDNQTRGSNKPVRRVKRGRPKKFKQSSPQPTETGESSQASIPGAEEASSKTRVQNEKATSKKQNTTSGLEMPGDQTSGSSEVLVKQKPGRPKKGSDRDPAVKRKPGRPRKSKAGGSIVNSSTNQPEHEQANSIIGGGISTTVETNSVQVVKPDSTSESTEPIDTNTGSKYTDTALEQHGSNTQAVHGGFDAGVPVSTRTRGRLSLSGATIDTGVELPKKSYKKRQKLTIKTQRKTKQKAGNTKSDNKNTLDSKDTKTVLDSSSNSETPLVNGDEVRTPENRRVPSKSPEIPLQSTVANQKSNSLEPGHVSDTSPLRAGEADGFYDGGHLEPLPEPISPIPEGNTRNNLLTELADKSIFTTGSSSHIEDQPPTNEEKSVKPRAFGKDAKKTMLANVAEWNIGPPSKKRRLKATHSNTLLSFVDETRPRKKTALKVDVSTINAPKLHDTTTN